MRRYFPVRPEAEAMFRHIEHIDKFTRDARFYDSQYRLHEQMVHSTVAREASEVHKRLSTASVAAADIAGEMRRGHVLDQCVYSRPVTAHCAIIRQNEQMRDAISQVSPVKNLLSDKSCFEVEKAVKALKSSFRN